MRFRKILKYSAIAAVGIFAAVVIKILIVDLQILDVAECHFATALGETEPLPPVTVIVTVDAEAGNWLRAQGEGISGRIWFDGDGDPGHNCKTAPNRDVYLGGHSFEMSEPGMVVLEDIGISKRQRARLDGPNFHYTMNVFSARLVYENNALDCQLPVGTIDTLMASDRTIRVHCKKL